MLTLVVQEMGNDGHVVIFWLMVNAHGIPRNINVVHVLANQYMLSG